MRKKNITELIQPCYFWLTLSAVCMLSFTVSANSTKYIPEENKWFEFKPSYFLFNASPMKKIYTNGGFQIQGSLSAPIHNKFDIYSSIGYRKLNGKALSTYEKTSLSVVPIDIGLKFVSQANKIFYSFFAIGPRYFHLHQKNDSQYVDPSIKANGIGLFMNTGFNTLIKQKFLLGLFGEYSYEKKMINPQLNHVFSNGKVQIGGLAFGVSLGYAF